jgi:pyridoxine 5-phosphate synthase
MRSSELDKIAAAVKAGNKLGMMVHAGHGLTYFNVRPVVGLGGVREFNIGHSIISRAVLVGMERAVREMKALVDGA